MSMTKAQRAAETERLRTVASGHEQAATAADAAGNYTAGDSHLKAAGAARDRLNWLHQKG